MNSSDMTQQLEDAVGRFTRLGEDLFRSWTAGVTRLADACGSLDLAPVMRASCTRCEIPPACWLPRSLGEVRSLVCPGGRAVLRLRVTNCDMRGRRFEAAPTKTGVAVTVTPTELALGAMQRGWFTATADLPADVKHGEQFELLLWVTGCNAYYLRWTIEAGAGASSCCHEITIDDCPDYVHHWYDHFYCARPCFATPKRTGAQ